MNGAKPNASIVAPRAKAIKCIRIEKPPVQTLAIILEGHNSLEYHYYA